MNKRTIFRAAGFVAAAGITAGLIGAGVGFTGAYFQDTESGTVLATTGEVDVSVNSNTPLASSFGPLMPGEAGAANTYNFINVGTGLVDLYLGSTNWNVVDANNQPFAYCAPANQDLRVSINSGPLNYGPLDLCNLPGGNAPILVAEDVAATSGRNVTVTLSLSSDAGNEWANKTGTATLAVIATQANAPFDPLSADQLTNDSQ